MGSTNLEVEQKPFPDPTVAKDEERANQSGAPVGSEDKEAEPTFDTGFFSWLQVLGSFFLFFNSWYVWVPKKKSYALTTAQGCD